MEHLEPKKEIPSHILAMIEDLTCDLQVAAISIEQLAVRIATAPVLAVVSNRDATKQN